MIAPVNRLPSGVVRSVLCRVVPLAEKVGLVRLLLSSSGPDRRVSSGFTPSEADLLHGLESQPKAAANLGDVPPVALTAGKPMTIVFVASALPDASALRFPHIQNQECTRVDQATVLHPSSGG